MSNLTLENAWIKLYEETLKGPVFENCDLESLCVGWCLAKGFTVDAAFGFYDHIAFRDE